MDRLAGPFTNFRIAFCLKVNYRHQKSPSLAPILIKINPPTPYYYSFKMHFNIIPHLDMSRDHPVSIATGYELDSRGSIFGRGKDSSLLHSVQTNSAKQLTSCPIITRGCFVGSKAAGK
jgi:hypothetical protein